MSDQKAIQGLWRQISEVSQGVEVSSAATHFLFEQDRVKHIWPSLVDGGEWATFEIDPQARPKRIVMTYESTERDGQVRRTVLRWLYELEGDTLRLCWPSVFGHFPDAFSDREHGIITLGRDPGPPPETKKPSGKQPIHLPGLGELTFDDNLDWWETTFELEPGKAAVGVRLSFDAEPPRPEIARMAAQLIEWLKANEARARAFAAAKQLDVHNDSWNDGAPITRDEFARRITLESAVRHSEGWIELYYNDGDLFWGHAIVVRVGAGGSFTRATIEG